MNLASKLALAAVLAAAAAAPATADEWWTYRGGPKATTSLSNPEATPDYGYYRGPYGYEPGLAYGGGYAYGGPEDAYGYRGRVNEPLYRCTGPATSDCYNSRALQGSR